MEIKVTYSDFEKVIKEAQIDFGEEKYIELTFVTPEEVEDEPSEGCEEEEELTNSDKSVIIDTRCDEDKEELRLKISCKDGGVSLDINNEVDYGELTKIISLLQRMSRQM